MEPDLRAVTPWDLARQQKCSPHSDKKSQRNKDGGNNGEALHDIIHPQVIVGYVKINWLQVHGLQNTEVIREICSHFEIDFLILHDALPIFLKKQLPLRNNLIS